MPDHAQLRKVLADAVEALGGSERPGQVQMAEAVAEAMSDGRHLLVQAGTGTGKSLAYLVPSLLNDRRVVVATATLALQHQLVERDIPRLVEAVGDDLDASYAVLKGRSNYACLHRIREGVPDDQGVLVDVPEGSMAGKVLELRSWAEQESKDKGSGERDAAPRHTDREWRQVSVSHRECLGAAKCPYGAECFAELAREKAHRSHLVVTNHSLLAIDAIEGVPMIPEYDVVVIDEAHELTARVTQAATDELFAAEVERAARRSQRHVEGNEADDLADASDALRAAINEASPGRFDAVPDELADALALVRDAARACLSAYPKGDEGEVDAGRTQARGAVQEVFATTERMAANAESDVLWLTEGGDRLPPRLCVAPLQVWEPMREKLLSDKTVVMTSATLMLGGDFSALATSVGLKPAERAELDIEPDVADDALPWTGLDVGSPFDYGQQAILYVARHLPPPGRDGLGEQTLDEIAELVDAADGRTLGPVLQPPGGRDRGRGDPRAAAAPDHARPGRRPAARAGQAVRRRPAHLPVRHPLAVAGARRTRRDLSAGADRPDPVPAPRRPADERPAAGGRARGRQRLHAGRRHPRRAAARPGLRPADPHHHRPRGGRGARPAAGDGALRRLPQGQPAADVADHRPAGRPRGARPAGVVRAGRVAASPSDRRRREGLRKPRTRRRRAMSVVSLSESIASMRSKTPSCWLWQRSFSLPPRSTSCPSWSDFRRAVTSSMACASSDHSSTPDTSTTNRPWWLLRTTSRASASLFRAVPTTLPLTMSTGPSGSTSK